MEVDMKGPLLHQNHRFREPGRTRFSCASVGDEETADQRNKFTLLSRSADTFLHLNLVAASDSPTFRAVGRCCDPSGQEGIS